LAAQRYGVIGAGILGVAVARRLQLVAPDAAVTVLEKEDRVAAHQTGHNSGVVHAGLYYAPGSLKARLCRRGMGLLRDFCAEHGLPYDERGKLVVARDAVEGERLRAIERRATENGVPDLRWLDGSELATLEPNVVGVAALHSPHTALVDFRGVTQALAKDVAAASGSVLLRSAVTGVTQVRSEVRVLAGETEHAFDRLIVCAGLQADRVARLAGDADAPAIVAFRGEYWRLVDERRDLVHRLIYPVPDPALPFLGVHFTPRIDGTVDIGPNAVLALSREGYRRADVDIRDVAEIARSRAFRRLAVKHWRTGLAEMRGSLSRRAFLVDARRFVPVLRCEDVKPAPAGVRAQAVDPDGSLVDDFRITRLGGVVAVRNAPSPAATSALAIAEHIVSLALEDGQRGMTSS
jgi:L-2-hydroxyglutarate oxidase LhgO